MSKTIISLQEICVNQNANVCSRYELEVAMQRITVVPRLSSVLETEVFYFAVGQVKIIGECFKYPEQQGGATN